jgi:hypothetical protein
MHPGSRIGVVDLYRPAIDFRDYGVKSCDLALARSKASSQRTARLTMA